MDKGFLTTILAGCMGTGVCLGGISEASNDWHYQQALSDPSFYSLTDENGKCIKDQLIDSVGNPVRQKVQQSLG